ncbi:hypothetical protein LZD49_20265 [Dyadobacter sp. CY261]|uniref:hypothetical protein n=1 Tax=Dyadobacter sp. CY261 TaxID=2907203 RepID=UPI001F3ED85E|nr:hypothetical protein [Dyadobacter sp. CY261]MCF0072826.1 hypothetical protein [Dyadobacter sp. CY261]
MSKTVIGIFEYESDAQNAQSYLLANGFGEGNVDFKTASYKAGDSPSSDETDDSFFETVANFFKELFNVDHDETERYIEAGKRGTIVTVHAASADEAVAAAHIMDEYGAIDVTNSRFNPQPGQEYEDPIVNPPSVSNGEEATPKSVEARGLYLKSRIIDRPLPHERRLRHQPYAAGGPAGTDPEQQATELNQTIAQRDALINEIIDNDETRVK